MKKLREEHENLSDLIFEEYRSGSDSFSSSGGDNFGEVRTKWHSAEDVRNRKVSLIQFHLLLTFHLLFCLSLFVLFQFKKKQTFI